MIGALFCTVLLGSAGAEARVVDRPTDICPVQIGEAMPEATLKTLDGEPRKLSKLVAEAPTVLVVYRGGWCPYCNRQLSQLEDAEPVLKRIGYRIVAVSPDPPGHLKATVTKNELSYLLLSDEGHELIGKLGLAYRTRAEDFGMPSDTRPPAELGLPAVLPVPAVYLLSPSGRVIYLYANVDYRVRLSGEVLLTAAKAYMVKK